MLYSMVNNIKSFGKINTETGDTLHNRPCYMMHEINKRCCGTASRSKSKLIYTVGHKKRAPKLLPKTLAVIDRF